MRSWLHWLRLGASLHGFISYHVEVPIIECPAKRISGISADDAAHTPHACPRLRGTCSFHGIAVTGDCDQPLPAAGRGDLEPLSRTGLGDPQVLRGTRADVLRSAELPARELATGAPPSCEISQLRLAGHEYGYTYWRVSRIHLDHSVPRPIPCELRPGTQSGTISPAAYLRYSKKHGGRRCPELLIVGSGFRISHRDPSHDIAAPHRRDCSRPPN